VNGTPVGTATFTFSGNDNATFAYTVGDVAQAKNITREVFGFPVPTCTWGAQPDLALASGFQDLWWAAPAGVESAGASISPTRVTSVYGTWFTYGLDGRPLWLVVAAGRSGTNAYSGKLYTARGPPFNSVPFDPDLVVPAKWETRASPSPTATAPPSPTR